MSKRFSHSSLECFEQCSQKYNLKYNERLEGTKISSPLFFGNAIDAALELFLLKKKVLLSEEELTLQLTYTAYEMFDREMRHQRGEDLPENPLCDYFFSDFDSSLYKMEDLAALRQRFPFITDFYSFHEKCCNKIRAKKDLTEKELPVYNFMNWLSLYRKGELMLKAYETEILPQIHEVFEIQKKFELPNADGDVLNGKIDFKASFKDNPSQVYCVDNKTSSKPYQADSTANSIQLAIYCEAESIDKAAYAVVGKAVNKKEPRIKTQLIKDTISEETFEKVFAEVEKKIAIIKKEEYNKLESPKKCFFFGKRCEFFNKCWKGTMDGIRKRPER